MAPDPNDDSAVLAAILEDRDAEDPIPLPKRPIHVRRHSLLRDAYTYGGAVFAVLSLFAGGIWAYSNLCHDVDSNTQAVQRVAEKHEESTKEIRSNTTHIQQMKVTLQHVDTTQQEMKRNLDQRMNRQDATLDRILEKLDNR